MNAPIPSSLVTLGSSNNDDIRLDLVNAETDSLVRGFTDLTDKPSGFVIDLSKTSVKQFSLLADAEMSESVRFEGTIKALDSTTTRINQLENTVPYAMFGDASKGQNRFGRDVYGIDLVPGEYSFKITAFSENRGQGTITDIEELDFTVINGAPIGAMISGETITGTSGDDRLIGTKNDDTLLGVNRLERKVAGVNPADVALGRGEKDRLTGSLGADTFVLGDSKSAFYDDGVSDFWHGRDYAIVTDFYSHNEGDRIQLHGDANDYRLGASNPLEIDGGRAIYLKQGGPDELIAVVQGDGNLNLSDSSQFEYAMAA